MVRIRRNGNEQRRQQIDEQRFAKKVEALDGDALSAALDQNIAWLKKHLGHSDDVVVREFCYGGDPRLRAAILMIDGLTNSNRIHEDVLRSMMLTAPGDAQDPAFAPSEAAQYLMKNTLPVGELRAVVRLRDVIKVVLTGDTALLLDGCQEALVISAKGWAKRSVDEPKSESVVRGPRDAFGETLRINTALLRRRIKDPDLRIKNFTVGARSNTDVAVVYIEGVAQQGIIDEIERRITEIELDGVFEGGYIEQFIEDNHWSPFPQIQNTERPDKAAANLLEGKAVILVDGSPYALIAPSVLTQFYHSPEDYYERFLISTLLRFIRALSMTMALLLPSLYISFSSFHPEMIPSKLVIAMAAGRATVPFPSVVEAFAMEVSIEILREASVRLPGPIGPTIGIVGALIVGEAAVQAGIVSPIMVIVVALTTIGSFAAPSYNAAIALRMLRFPIMLLAAMFGLYGVMLFLIIIVVHLCSLKSFGVPYLSPFTQGTFRALGDSMIRIPLYKMTKRPDVFAKDQERKRINSSSAEDVEHDSASEGPAERPQEP
ncbi:spore germination protein [Tumebacillus sp. BK434]|uniref:spore germination protein n=1 Tax=Tumebacillus sp. BK434 TaxID=2512169 RepID=UPI001FB52E0B|nr:spore germination protein [Tumebacillus sp. BK434]